MTPYAVLAEYVSYGLLIYLVSMLVLYVGIKIWQCVSHDPDDKHTPLLNYVINGLFWTLSFIGYYIGNQYFG